jgi:hypothetical protein
MEENAMTTFGLIHRLLGGRGAATIMASFGIAWLLSTGVAHADDFCCPCKNKPQSIEADDKATATAQCSIVCKRFVMAKSGRCEGDAPAAVAAPPAAAPAPAAAPSAAAGSATVLLYKSDNCSGEAATVTASSARLTDGFLSFQGDSGEPVQAWQKPDFSGESTQPVAPGICLSPGWNISGVKIGK